MQHVFASDLNGVLWERYVTIPADYKAKDLLIDYREFLGSQLLFKIFDFDYRVLMRATVSLNNLYLTGSGMSLDDYNDMMPMYTMFMNVTSLAGMKLYLLYKVKLYLTVPNRIYGSGVKTDINGVMSNRINIVNDYELVEDLKVYLDILKKESVVVGKTELDLTDIDYKYLSKMLMYYKLSNEDICVVERRPE